MKIAIIFIFIIIVLSCSENIKNIDYGNKSSKSQHYLPFIPQSGAAFIDRFTDISNQDTMTHYVNQIDLECRSIDLELRKVYRRDQQYRDSLQSLLNRSSEKRKYYSQMMTKNDQVNEMIVQHILRSIGWTDSCGFNNEAHMGIWFSLIHSQNVSFNIESLKYVESAFKDSIISAIEYAYLIDNIYVKSGGKQKYGTFSRIGKKLTRDVYPRISISIDSINLERELIGLERIE